MTAAAQIPEDTGRMDELTQTIRHARNAMVTTLGVLLEAATENGASGLHEADGALSMTTTPACRPQGIVASNRPTPLR